MTDKSPVKGWCPGAHRPMMSGDGLIVRIRPRLGRITKRQALGLCDISRVLGNGIIDLTSRANLQLRGIAEHDHQTVLDQLLALDVLDPTPDGEARRNITVTPTWTADDLTHRLHDAICARLGELPALPAKMGIAIDTGPHRLLLTTSADFRIERGVDAPLILRADGADTGCPITEATAIDALIALANWFVETNGAAAKRMAPHIAQTPLAKAWTTAAPSPAGAPLTPGRSSSGHILGAPFGSIEAAALAALLQD
ncbi:MAG: cobalamin biosynthesis protein CobG, partial [Pseudomonadota bacterium]